ncbi:hypothetical protein BC829DRAFT_450218 [Chytridium lagenaria]|nr:hypothetical protein BC829DRAFT_450218 [Chytridium lagenaria]
MFRMASLCSTHRGGTLLTSSRQRFTTMRAALINKDVARRKAVAGRANTLTQTSPHRSLFSTSSLPYEEQLAIEREIADEMPQVPAYNYQQKDKVIENEDPALRLLHPEGGKWIPIPWIHWGLHTEGGKCIPALLEGLDGRYKPIQQVADFAIEASGWYPENRDMANEQEFYEKVMEV